MQTVGPRGPWFIDVLNPEGESKSIINGLRMAKKAGFVPVMARRRLMNEPEVRLLRSSRITVPRGGSDGLFDEGRHLRLALAQLARAEEGHHEKALVRVTNRLAKMVVEPTETVILEIGLLQFSLSNEIDRVTTHPAVLLPAAYADPQPPSESE
ncbi:MAG: hypothetical protein LBK42_02260 [Propionibacteriaceae bacterium]|nr:hypothetical protein [Propionibacteriaceae bacterium]